MGSRCPRPPMSPSVPRWSRQSARHVKSSRTAGNSLYPPPAPSASSGDGERPDLPASGPEGVLYAAQLRNRAPAMRAGEDFCAIGGCNSAPTVLPTPPTQPLRATLRQARGDGTLLDQPLFVLDKLIFLNYYQTLLRFNQQLRNLCPGQYEHSSSDEHQHRRTRHWPRQ